MDETEWILKQFKPGVPGVAVEVGAWDGIEGSHIYPLENRYGWKTLAIEPNPALEDKLKLRRDHVWMGAAGSVRGQAVFQIHCNGPSGYSSLLPQKWRAGDNVPWKAEFVKVLPLDDILDLMAFDSMDVLLIDTEGTELDVLRGTNLDRWHPKCLIVESWEEDNDVLPYLHRRGYNRVERIDQNDLFLRR